MHSLYWRIFLTFWLALALILVGTVTVALNTASQHRTESAWFQRGQLYASAARAFESGGPAGLAKWLEDLRSTEPFSRTFVVEPSGKEMLGRPLPRALGVVQAGGMRMGQVGCSRDSLLPSRLALRIALFSRQPAEDWRAGLGRARPWTLPP